MCQYIIPQITSSPPITLLILLVSITHKHNERKTKTENNSTTNILLDSLNGIAKIHQLLTF